MYDLYRAEDLIEQVEVLLKYGIMGKETEKEKVNREIMTLFDFVETITKITCNNCKFKATFDGDMFDCIDAIYEDGWRVIKEKCLCKTCIKELK